MELVIFIIAWVMLMIVSRVGRMQAQVNGTSPLRRSPPAVRSDKPYDRQAFMSDVAGYASIDEIVEKRREG